MPGAATAFVQHPAMSDQLCNGAMGYVVEMLAELWLWVFSAIKGNFGPA
jgi:hypothetical protein